jgi:hypothetical protein
MPDGEDPEDYGPILATGEVNGYRWEYRASTINGECWEWASVNSGTKLIVSGGAVAGGSSTPDPMPQGTTHHITGVGDVTAGDARQYPSVVHGSVSAEVAEVRVNFAGGDHANAQLVGEAERDGKFFVMGYPGSAEWLTIDALSADGTKLDQAVSEPSGRRPRSRKWRWR